MTSPRRFEQDLPALLADLYLAGIPDYRDDLVQQTARVRQRPAWTFPERWLPMDLVTKVVPGAPRVPWRALGILALLALLIAASLVAYVGSRPRLPAPFGPARNGLILYSDGGDIVARDTVGATPRRIVSDPEEDASPLFSPLGDHFIFLRRLTTTSASIMIARADGSDVRVLAGPMVPPDMWDWAADGSAIVIGREGGRELIRIPTDGSPQQTLATPPMSERIDVRPPDGAQILVRGRDDAGDPGLYLIHQDGSSPVQLRLPSSGDSEHDYAHGVAWSADGRQLAYVIVESHPASGVDSGLRIHVADIDIDGSVTRDRALEFDAAHDNELNPGFVPGTGELVFQTREGETGDFLNIGSLSGDRPPARLGEGGSTSGGGIGYVIDPDGNGLLAYYWTEQVAWRYDFRTKQSTQLDLGADDIATWQRLAP